MTNMQEMLGSMGEGEEGIATNVDIVFVIDATRSMRTTIDMVKESALSFQDKLYDFMDEAKRSINNLRIKVVWFRDFYYDGNYAYDESKFFELPEEKEEFRDFVNGIHEAGGGDDPESGLEALTMAMRSDFVQDSGYLFTKRRTTWLPILLFCLLMRRHIPSRIMTSSQQKRQRRDASLLCIPKTCRRISANSIMRGKAMQ